MRRFHLPLCAALALTGWMWPVSSLPATPSFEPGEQVWCGIEKAYVDAPHECCSGSPEHFDFCEECQGYYGDFPNHLHEGKTQPLPPSVAAQSPQTGFGENHPTGGENVGNAPLETASGFLDRVPLPVKAAVAGVVLVLVVALLWPRRRADGAVFVFRRGVPVGTVLVPDLLVCEEEPTFDGGMSRGYRAMWYDGRHWKPAFVKRMVGAGMRQDVRFPALRFESDILQRLSETGVVPEVLVPAQEKNLPGEGAWAFYAMRIAGGEPWPERGGLGRDTRHALYFLCEALVRLHERGIGHHDLKPQNIFWNRRNERITLIDFGSAIDHRETAPDRLINPISGLVAGTRPWVPPDSDGGILANLSIASEAWVYGLLFCEALVGGIHDVDRTKRRWPERPDDRDWLRDSLAQATSPAVADAVVDGLFALQRGQRMPLNEFLALLYKERWVSR